MLSLQIIRRTVAMARSPLGDISKLLDEMHAVVLQKLPEALHAPRVGIVCGSGLSTLAEKSMRNAVHIKYSEIPGFGESTGVHLLYVCVVKICSSVFSARAQERPGIWLHRRLSGRSDGCHAWAGKIARKAFCLT